MSALGAALAQGVASLGGPTTAGVIVAGGLVVGLLGGAYVGSGGGAGQQAVTSGELAVYPCPDQGPALATVKGGQKMLATGRTADGTWLRIHYPSPARTEAWVQAAPLSVTGAPDSLPVAECEPEFAAGSPSAEPGSTLTAVLNLSPSPAPPSPTPNVRPALSSLAASTGTISYDTGSYCPDAVKRVTFSVKATDSVGIEGVSLFWRKPGADSYAEAAMTRSSGSAKNGTWRVTLDTTTNGITTEGSLRYYAIGTDVDGATRRIPRSGSDDVTVAVCVNTGPSFSSLNSSAGADLSWDPLGVGKCQTATNITATVRDTDGVDSVRLYYRRPGDSSYQSKPMENTSGSRWFANLDTLGDKIIITDPPTDVLRWYIRAVDDTGLDNQTRTRTITINRCDTEAEFGTSSYYPSPMCPSRPTTFYGSASDPDGIGGSSAVLVYEYLRTDGTSKTVRKRMTGTRDGPWYYQVSILPGTDWSANRDTMTFYIETTDQFDGVSRGGSGKITVTNC